MQLLGGCGWLLGQCLVVVCLELDSGILGADGQHTGQLHGVWEGGQVHSDLALSREEKNVY